MISGDSHARKGEHDLAIIDFTKAHELDPKDAVALVARASAHFENDQHDCAIADFTEAIKLKPQNASYISARGMAYTAKGEYDLAIADYEEAIRLNPSDMGSFAARAAAYDAKGQFDRAVADWDQTIKLARQGKVFSSRGLTYAKKGSKTVKRAMLIAAVCIVGTVLVLIKVGSSQRDCLYINPVAHLDPSDNYKDCM
jgi:tetratricopeptide (TPR) repeat protein